MFAVVLLAVLGVTLGFPSGAPQSSCRNMMPLHRSRPQTDESPYVLTIVGGATTYKPNATIEVLIHAPETREAVRGFILEARIISDYNRGPVGTFENEERTMKTICEEKALTHRTWRSQASFKATWKAPLLEIGDIVFVATVLKKYEIFWTNVRSSVLSYYIPPPTTTEHSKVVPFANVTAQCQETLLKELPEERPHVAILCSGESDCPCGWLCCPSCSTECSGHAICRQKAEKGEEDDGDDDVDDGYDEDLNQLL